MNQHVNERIEFHVVVYQKVYIHLLLHKPVGVVNQRVNETIRNALNFMCLSIRKSIYICYYTNLCM